MDVRSEVAIQPLPASSIAADFGLGPIDQISFAVTSVERSLPWYEGLHHVRFRVADLDAKTEQLAAAGFEVIFSGTTPHSSFAYVQSPASLGHTVIELIQPASPQRTGEAR
jgi:hypothetical protein